MRKKLITCCREQLQTHKKVENILKFLKSLKNKLYVLFLDYTVKIYDDVLMGLQSDEPKIHLLRKMLVNLIMKVLCSFVKPAFMSSCLPEAVDFKSSYCLKDKDLVMGDAAHSFIGDFYINDLRNMRIKQFFV
ncbi:hypothetical protein CHS0354_001198 [Potamilus streckersoni]|uniref:Uncharacterized protein n=1 Tax=Potamilus streckersoni TaxID=2493646 RepID=A0AAE0VEW4_9BIVA|nr:hypothetical protein CHS0354_001198 [Potamilus streckersoni]